MWIAARSTGAVVGDAHRGTASPGCGSAGLWSAQRMLKKLSTGFVALVLLLFAAPPPTANADGLLLMSVGDGRCSQAITLLARMDGSQNTSAVTNLVCGMVADGNWSSVPDGLQVYAINSTANANLNWIPPAMGRLQLDHQPSPPIKATPRRATPLILPWFSIPARPAAT
jgi:hypothetical protein